MNDSAKISQNVNTSKLGSIPKPKIKKTSIFKFLIIWICGVYAKITYRISYNKEQIKAYRKIKGPVLALCNHQSPMDIAIALLALYPKRPAILVGIGVFFDKQVGGLVRMLKNNIPKRQLTTDYESVKYIKKMIDAGISVIVFPEGRFSIGGYTGRIADTIGKMAKWLGAPVVTIRNNGVYLTRPRFLMGFRRGRILTEVNITADKNEIKVVDEKELNLRIKSQLEYNDFDYQEKNNIAFVNKKFSNTEGFKEIIYKCPKCLSEYQIEAEGNSLHCKNCGYIADINEYNVITARNNDITLGRIDKWYLFQYEELKKEILESDNYELKQNCKLEKLNMISGDYEFIDEGELTLSKDGYYFKGKHREIEYNLPNPPVIIMFDSSSIETYIKDEIYKLVLSQKDMAIKFGIATELLFDLCQTDRRKK